MYEFSFILNSKVIKFQMKTAATQSIYLHHS